MTEETRVIADRYVLGREIARGGMGSVHEAIHKVSKKKLAVKLLFPSYAEDAASQARFMREASAPAQIGHEGIVEVYDAGVEKDGTLYVAMELLTGETMRDRIERGGIGMPEFFWMFQHSLDPLAAAHRIGIIHRDLKPENLFLLKKSNGQIVMKVLDFGIARDLAAQQQNMTQTGTTMGTPHYMAPEQAMSAKGVVASADVWAMGAMMYEIVSGQVPFDGETASAVIVHACVQPLRSLAEAAPGVPGPLAQLIERCLNKDPAHRPQDAGALLHELTAVAAQLGVSAQGMAPMGGGAGPSNASSYVAHPTAAPAGTFPTPAPTAFAQHVPTPPPGSPAAAMGSQPSMPGAQPYASQGAMPGAQPYPSQGAMPGAQPYASQGSMPGAAPGYATPGSMPSPFVAPGGAPYGSPQFGTVNAPPAFNPPAKTGRSPMVYVAIGGVVAVLGSVGAYFAFSGSGDAASSAAAPALQVPGTPTVPGAAVPTPPAVPAVPTPNTAAPQGVQTFPGALATGDRTLQSGEFADVYTLQFAQGQRFRVRVHADKFDAYLIVKSPSGVSQDNDDGTADTRDPMLEITANEAGTWQFVATSFQPGESGDYELSVETLP